jgi:hypothetical protein
MTICHKGCARRLCYKQLTSQEITLAHQDGPAKLQGFRESSTGKMVI